MELWMRNGNGSSWEHWRDVLVGIEQAARAAPRAVVFATTGDPAEEPALLSALRLVRRLAASVPDVVVMSAHPSKAAFEKVAEEGSAQMYLLSSAKFGDGPPVRVERDRVSSAVCPALHVCPEGGRVLSVCGRWYDKMVLARHHLNRWCLDRHDSCPHWV